MDRHGHVTRRHSATFRLEKHGAVHVIAFYEQTSLSGNRPGRSYRCDFAYVYRVDEGVLLDAPGLFISRRTYQRDPSVYVWQRVK